MNRPHDWSQRLKVWLESERRGDEPIAWGERDCLLFCADAVRAMLDHDPAASLRGTYTTEQGALEIVENAGGMAALITLQLETAPYENPNFAKRGDIVLVEADAGLFDGAGGVVWENRVWALVPGRGVHPMPRLPVIAAWPVGW